MDPTFGLLTLGVATWFIGLLSVAFLFCSVLLVLTVLIQRPQGGGLSGAFGAGAGSGETAFGARTGDALTIATIAFFVIWLLVAVGLVWVMQPDRAAGITTELQSTEAPGVPSEGPTGPQTTAPGDEGAAPPAGATEQPAGEPEAPAGQTGEGEAPEQPAGPAPEQTEEQQGEDAGDTGSGPGGG